MTYFIYLKSRISLCPIFLPKRLKQRPLNDHWPLQQRLWRPKISPNGRHDRQYLDVATILTNFDSFAFSIYKISIK